MGGGSEWGKVAGKTAGAAAGAAVGRKLMNATNGMAVGGMMLVVGAAYYVFQGDKKNRSRQLHPVVGDGQVHTGH